MEMEYIIISAAITIVSILLLMISIHSYRIYRNKKLLFVLFVFLFFMIRGIILSLGVLYEPFEPFVSSYYTWLIDLVILTLLYGAALKR